MRGSRRGAGWRWRKKRRRRGRRYVCGGCEHQGGYRKQQGFHVSSPNLIGVSRVPADKRTPGDLMKSRCLYKREFLIGPVRKTHSGVTTAMRTILPAFGRRLRPAARMARGYARSHDLWPRAEKSRMIKKNAKLFGSR